MLFYSRFVVIRGRSLWHRATKGRMDRPIDKHRSGRNHILKLWRAIYPSCDPSNYCLPFVLLHSKTRPSKLNCSGDFSHVPRLHLPRKQKTFPRPLDVEPKYSAYSSWKSIYAKSQFSKAEEYVSLVTARTPIYGNLLGSMVIPCVTNQPGSLLRDLLLPAQSILVHGSNQWNDSLTGHLEKGAALELLCRLLFIDGSNPARDNHKAFDHRISRRPRGALTAELFVYDASNAFVFALSALEWLTLLQHLVLFHPSS